MEKMGWEKGKGLGANENGITEHIKATYKSDSRGLGCTPQDADAWIAHQDDFNDLLKALNSQSEAGTQEEKVEKTEHVDGRKRYYGRFARGQVQTLRSTDDLDCIFGKRKGQSKTAEPDERPAPEPDCADGEEKSHGLTTVTSTSSVQEYFAKKMAEMKARKGVNTREADSGETSPGRNDDALNCDKKKQKSSMFGSVSFSYDEVREVSGSADVEEAASKSCRGWYEDFLENRSGNVENIEVKDKSSKKKKEKKTKSDTEDNDFEEKVKMSDSKKQKKKKRGKVLDDSVAVVNSCSVLESPELTTAAEVAGNKQSKRKKKNKDSEAASVYEGDSTANITEEKDVKKQKETRKASKKDECEDKKQSKKKNKENEAVAAASECEDVNTVNISDESEDKKKQKKKKRKASNKDEIVVNSLNKCALDADEVDANKTAIDTSNLKHSSNGLVTHSSDDNKLEKENSGSTEHKKKNKKKRKQSEVTDEESKPVENKCDNNVEVTVESKKKKKKRKHSEINDQESKPVDSECDKTDDATVEPKKKKKRREGNDNDAQDTEDAAAAEHKSNIASGNQNVIDVSQSSEQKEKKKRKRKKKAKPLQDQGVKSNAFFPGSNLAEIVGYGHKSREIKKSLKEDSKSSKQKA